MISTFRVIASWLSKGALLFHAVGGVHVIALHAHVVHGVAHAIGLHIVLHHAAIVFHLFCMADHCHQAE